MSPPLSLSRSLWCIIQDDRVGKPDPTHLSTAHLFVATGNQVAAQLLAPAQTTNQDPSGSNSPKTWVLSHQFNSPLVVLIMKLQRSMLNAISVPRSTKNVKKTKYAAKPSKRKARVFLGPWFPSCSCNSSSQTSQFVNKCTSSIHPTYLSLI